MGERATLSVGSQGIERPTEIKVNDRQLDVAHEFTYLGQQCQTIRFGH